MQPKISATLKYICPVCGFLLDYPAANFNICPSCGVEFDADTVEYSIEELQQAWILRGMAWSSPVIKRPVEYNPLAQLKNLDVQGITASSPEKQLEGTLSEPQLGNRMRPAGSEMTVGHLRFRVA